MIIGVWGQILENAKKRCTFITKIHQISKYHWIWMIDKNHEKWWFQKLEKEFAMAGSRTRVNCLEGSYANRYTTNAWRIIPFAHNYQFKCFNFNVHNWFIIQGYKIFSVQRCNEYHIRNEYSNLTFFDLNIVVVGRYIVGLFIV